MGEELNVIWKEICSNVKEQVSSDTFKRWFSMKHFGKKVLEEFDYIFPQNKETKSSAKE